MQRRSSELGHALVLWDLRIHIRLHLGCTCPIWSTVFRQ